MGCSKWKASQRPPAVIVVILLLLTSDRCFLFSPAADGSLTLEGEGKKRTAAKEIIGLSHKLNAFPRSYAELLVSVDWEETRPGAAAAVTVSNIALDIV